MMSSHRRLAILAEHVVANETSSTVAWPSSWPTGQTSDSGITHSILISGNPLCMEISEEDEVSWQYRGEGAGDSRPGTRDASKLSNGNYLVTLSDKVVEVMPGQQEAVWTYELDRSINKEFMGAQRLADGSTVVTECGDNPRVCEVASDGRTILAEIPIQPETENSHQQSRMGRKLANGNYLVPHRVACVKECECGPCAHPAVHGGVCCGCVHMQVSLTAVLRALRVVSCADDSSGAVIHEFRTDIPELEGTAGLTAFASGKPTNGLAATADAQARSSFFAQRLDDGETVITCASGNRMCVFDRNRQLVWHVNNAELGGVLNDVCGLHVLKSGNFLVSTYGNKTADGVKMLEISRADKTIVWSYHNPAVQWVHTLQVLSTNGQPE